MLGAGSKLAAAIEETQGKERKRKARKTRKTDKPSMHLDRVIIDTQRPSSKKRKIEKIMPRRRYAPSVSANSTFYHQPYKSITAHSPQPTAHSVSSKSSNST
jgi:hypothetical protein